MKTWEKWTKEELLKLPRRAWGVKSSEYDSVLLVNTRMRHDSGFNLFAVVGCIEDVPVEIAGFMDDFRFGDFENFDKMTTEIRVNSLALDCSMKGVFRIHCFEKIKVGTNMSTTNFWLKECK